MCLTIKMDTLDTHYYYQETESDSDDEATSVEKANHYCLLCNFFMDF